MAARLYEFLLERRLLESLANESGEPWADQVAAMLSKLERPISQALRATR